MFNKKWFFAAWSNKKFDWKLKSCWSILGNNPGDFEHWWHVNTDIRSTGDGEFWMSISLGLVPLLLTTGAKWAVSLNVTLAWFHAPMMPIDAQYTKFISGFAQKWSGWWFGTCFCPIYWECHHPNCYSQPSFFRVVGLNHQPVIARISHGATDVEAWGKTDGKALKSP